VSPLRTKNTASGVDEQYARRLVRQHVEALRVKDDEAGSTVLTLQALRASPLYLREQAGVKVGAGLKKGTRAWHVDPVKEGGNALMIFSADYDARSLRVLQPSLMQPALAILTRHALERLYLRLKTNAWSDVARALVPLTMLDRPAYPNDELEVETAAGRWCCVTEWVTTSFAPESALAWIVKTFIAPKGMH